MKKEEDEFENTVLCPECGEPMLPELDDPERYYCEDCGREWIIIEIREVEEGEEK